MLKYRFPEEQSHVKVKEYSKGWWLVLVSLFKQEVET